MWLNILYISINTQYFVSCPFKTVIAEMERINGPHVRPLFGWMVDRLVGRLAVQLVGWFIGWSVCCLVWRLIFLS